MIKKNIPVKTTMQISVWPAIGETIKPWCYCVELRGIKLAMGNNYDTEDAAYKAAMLDAAAYKSQLEA